jgi:hypothetical protein
VDKRRVGLPDDGLGALPLLRHLILVDEKSSTYKIALLRVLARIADTAAGMARYEADSVVVPLGLVSLFWMRMYKPLIENALPQMPSSHLGTGPGFVTDSFLALRPSPRSSCALAPCSADRRRSICTEVFRRFRR